MQGKLDELRAWRKALPVALRPDPGLSPESRTSKAYGEFLYQLAERWDFNVAEILAQCEPLRQELERMAKHLAQRLRVWLRWARRRVLNPWQEVDAFSEPRDPQRVEVSAVQVKAISEWFARWLTGVDEFEAHPLGKSLAGYFGADPLRAEVPDFGHCRFDRKPKACGLWSMESNGDGPPWAEFIPKKHADDGTKQDVGGARNLLGQQLARSLLRDKLVPFGAELASLLHNRWVFALQFVPPELFELHRMQANSPWTAAFVLDWLVSRDGLIANVNARGNGNACNFWSQLSPWVDQMNRPYRVWIHEFFLKEASWQHISSTAPYPASTVLGDLFLAPEGKHKHKRNAIVRDPSVTYGVACFAAFALDQLCAGLRDDDATASKPDPKTQSLGRIAQALQLKAQNPRMTMSEIAARVGCSPSTLSRNPAFQRATHASRSGQIRRGRKDQSGSIEAEDYATT